MIVPNDIKKVLRKKFTNALMYWVMLSIAISLLIIFVCEPALNLINKRVKFIIYTILLLIPIIVSKIYRFLFDFSWKGTVVKVYTQSGEEYSDPVAGKMIIQTITIYLIIKLDNGKEIVREIYHGPRKNENFVEKYNVGDVVVHVKWSKIYQIQSTTNKSLNCILCGNENLKTNEKCKICGHTLHIC